jgi:Domain of unknown function (DUF305)
VEVSFYASPIVQDTRVFGDKLSDMKIVILSCHARIVFASLSHRFRESILGSLRVLVPSFWMIAGVMCLVEELTIPASSQGRMDMSGGRPTDCGPSPSGFPNEDAFLADNAAAMNKMMTDMSPEPTGDIDHDFVAMMAPHHQGAIDMALAELHHGQNERLKRIAQEIVVTQQQEIVAMKLAIGDPLPPQSGSPTDFGEPTMQASDCGLPMHFPVNKNQDPCK